MPAFVVAAEISSRVWVLSGVGLVLVIIAFIMYLLADAAERRRDYYTRDPLGYAALVPLIAGLLLLLIAVFSI
jgi:threonine/homoserine/homoserine lactone efflux protein